MSTERRDSIRVVRWLLILVALTHIPVGIGLMFSHTAQRGMALMYGASFFWTVRDLYLVRMLGTFICAIGTLSAIAAREPSRHGVAIFVLVELLALRVIQRSLYAEEIQRGLGVSGLMNAGTSILLVFIGGGLAFSYYRSRMPATEPEDR